MQHRFLLDRRAFIASALGLPFLTLGATPQRSAFVCPPCGCASDGRVFSQAGPCPSCGMTLIAQTDSAAPYGKAQFPGGRRSVQIPFDLLANAVYFPALINGKGPYLFALDTGSTNSVVASEVSQELGIVNGARFLSSGAGSDSNAASKIESIAFTFPDGLVRSTTQAAAISMAGLWPLIGRRFYGDIGYDVIAPFVVELDYGQRVLTLHDPETYTYQGPGSTLSFGLFGHYDPQIDGELIVPRQGAIPVRFTIDTGAGGTIVSTPLVDKYHLLEAVGRTVATQDEGVGGAEPTEVAARISGLRIGPYAIEAPVVALSRDTMGSLSNEAISVNLGGNILRRFTVIIDYARNRLTLEPNEHLSEPFDYDASGLLLAASGEDFRTFVIRAVIPHSAADEAGLAKGDRIIVVGGTPAKEFALWQLQDRLKESGETVKITIERDNATLEKTLALRALL